jgi:hypothetical protein
MAGPWRGALAVALLTGWASMAEGQENMISPPPPLPWPAAETDTSVQSSFAITDLRREVELRTNTELCRQRMERNHETVPPMFNWELCPQSHKDAIAAGQGLFNWKDGARPTQCGGACIGRPNLSQTTYTDRPNVVYAMLYGQLDFRIDTTFDRDVTYFYEAQFHCTMDPGHQGGNLGVRMLFGQPVVSEAGWLESVVDFALLPLNISRAVEDGIKAGLPGIGPSSSGTGYRCMSVGPKRADSLAYDQIIFRQPRAGNRPLADAASTAAVGRLATVHFLGVTRTPPVPGYTPPAESGSFMVYLNGEPVVFPDLPELQLPPAGGSTALNLCRRVDVGGADQLQIIFANSNGGGVWSQFGQHQSYGAGQAHRMTTGRTVVVAGLPSPSGAPHPPGGSKPRTLVLREYQLLYSVEYTAPPTEVASEPAPSPGRPGRGERPGGRVPERDPGRGGRACQKI